MCSLFLNLAHLIIFESCSEIDLNPLLSAQSAGSAFLSFSPSKKPSFTWMDEGFFYDFPTGINYFISCTFMSAMMNDHYIKKTDI
jgi:hypothetical protein